MQTDMHVRPLVLVSVSAPEDVVLLTQWETHLQPLQQARLISVWSERHLTPGTDRMQEYQRQVNAADLVVLLLSADFFADSDCKVLMDQALQHSRTSALRVIPVLLRPAVWQESPLEMLRPWPPDEKPIVLWSNQDEGWHVCVQELRRLLGRRIFERHTLPGHADPDWDRMLRRLRRSYKELRELSLHGIAWMELGLSTRSDLVSNVTNLLFRFPQGERLLPSGTQVLDAYDEAEGELLILGAPGAGKSTLLLDLAQQLVDRAQTVDLPLLPVILRLSTWAIERSTLEEWMVEQLSQTYDVPRHLSKRWVKQGRLLPLLDGLDEMEEVARPACITAINRYHRTHLTPLVVCSRHAEYEAAIEHERLALQSAVIMQPLSNEQIEDYLQTTGPSFTGVREALSQQHALWKLATTPLMLSVLLLTYRDVSTKDIVKHETDLEQQVWTDYVARQVAEKGNIARYSLEQTHTVLRWLAQQLRVHQQANFYAEHLSIDWLVRTQQRTVIQLTILIPSIAIGVCVSLLVPIFLLYSTNPIFLLQMGVLGGFVGGCLRLVVVERSPAIRRGLFTSTARHVRNAILLGGLIAAISGLSLHLQGGYGMNDWLRDACILWIGSMLSFWVFQMLIEHQEKLSLSVTHKQLNLWRRMVTWVKALLFSRICQAVASLGIGMGLTYGLSNWMFDELHRDVVAGLSVGLANGVFEGPSNELSNGLSIGLSVSIVAVLVHVILNNSLRTLRFAERIRWTWHSFFQPEHLRATVLVTVISFLLYGLLSGLSWLVSFSQFEGLPKTLTWGLSDALINGQIFGPSVGFLYWFLMGLYGGMKQEHLEDQGRFLFNQGIRRSLRNGLLLSLISAIIVTAIGMLYGGLGTVLRFWWRGDWSLALGNGLNSVRIYWESSALWPSNGWIVLVTGMVVMWALSGGPTVLRHYVIRWLLARHHLFPFRAQAFLDNATSQVLLQRVGGGYSFIHRRLQDYFADTNVPPSQN